MYLSPYLIFLNCTSTYYVAHLALHRSTVVYSLYLTLPYHIVPYCTIPYHPLQPVPHHTTCTLPYLIFLYLTLPYLTIPYSLYLIILLAPYHTSSFCTLLYHTPYQPLQPVPHHTTCTLPYLIFLYLTVPYTLTSLTACTSSYYLHLTIPHLSVPYSTIPYHSLQPVPHHTTCTLPYLIFLYLTLPYLTIPHSLYLIISTTYKYLTIPHLSVPYFTIHLTIPYSLYLIIQLAPYHTSSFCTLLYMYLTLP